MQALTNNSLSANPLISNLQQRKSLNPPPFPPSQTNLGETFLEMVQFFRPDFFKRGTLSPNRGRSYYLAM